MTASIRAYRVERDSMGPVRVPKRAYYGAQTQRAIENFPVSDWRFGREFIYALGLLKFASARANAELGLLGKKFAAAVEQAAQEVMGGRWMTNSWSISFKPAPGHPPT